MKNLSSEICIKLKNARREAGLSQSVVAAEVGCKQSALSMFEQGQPTKLNDEVIEKLAKKFGVELKEADDCSGASTTGTAFTIPFSTSTSYHHLKGFCPNPGCPSNHAFLVDGRTLYLPNRDEADPVGGKFCAFCGEILEKRCPNCGAPVHAGAICAHCGQPYLAV